MFNKFFFDLPKTFFFTAYSLICGFAYLCGYWYNFKIDLQIVFSLLSPLDIIKSFIIPLISAIGIIIAQLLMNYIATYESPNYKKLIKNFNDTCGIYGPPAKENKLLKAIFSQYFIASIFIVSSGSYVIYKFFSSDDRTYFIGFVIGSACFMAMLAIFTIYDEFGFKKIERYLLIVFSICMLPSIVYFIGATSGKNAIKDEKALVMLDNAACSSDPKEKYVLLSLYGSKGISISLKDNSICLFEAEKSSFKSLTPIHPAS
ncbi:hypothetical protein ACKTG8_000693 [Cronobacter sakazakii]|uniref:hypothetical protein n=4 Tax=Cronobacter sakazakii TaxID=28141 RepID=UPI0006CF7AF1|nr:hypothetical protein [Cronobacter sakazakii]ELQ6011727.1 hypothetical protein [Cronobacter sakazakii]ELY2494190.1 hypothetical protein [Cronobacter sakazakii]ELY2734642.1 hypothetical protein [Cronobacter sakazakii]ELY7499598.1 hypothetical protein [Cronobacter sakazakii]EMD7598529.1 hypothetical protein [Cronobacter sakazakii]